MSVPFWLAFITSALAHLAATATLTTNIESGQKVETQSLMVEVINEQSARAPFVATAVRHSPPLEISPLSILTPKPLIEIQPIPPRELQLSKELTSGAIATKPPSNLTETQLTVGTAPPLQLREHNTVRRSIGRLLTSERLETENIIVQAKTHPPPTLSTAISIVPPMLSRTQHETSPSLSVLMPQSVLRSSKNAVSIIVQPSLWAPDQFDERSLQTLETESGAGPQTRTASSQGPTPPRHVGPMPAPPRASDIRGPQSIVRPMPAETPSQPIVSPELDSTEPSAEHTALSIHVHGPKQHESTVDYKNPALGNRPPEYPRRARRQGLEGRVVIGVSVSTQGRPRKVFVTESSGLEIFDDAALTAIKQWRFLPARRGGTPVDTSVLIPIVFRLHD